MTRDTSKIELQEMIYRRSSGMPLHISATGEDTPPPASLMATTTQRQCKIIHNLRHNPRPIY